MTMQARRLRSRPRDFLVVDGRPLGEGPDGA